MRTQNALHKLTWFAICAALVFAVYFMNVADSEIITFQEENAAPSENSSAVSPSSSQAFVCAMGF